ncbi:hypothetical protein [Pseudonocardia sp. H11422]|uniref:hypothetical protein n=1 Tax=Pseudonocardia sp. H11422 TaxID=2835866 RepID=UPI001BDD1013|nr:hypothetical protein [Pseudonocardia sp. H11422]
MSAARDYKAIVAGITAAADELRERDRERAVELSRDLVGLDDAMVRAGERAAMTRLGVNLHWEAALEMLWAESWMTLRPMPAPDERVDPANIDALDAAVEQRFAELRDATRRGFGLRGFGLGRR